MQDRREASVLPHDLHLKRRDFSDCALRRRRSLGPRPHQRFQWMSRIGMSRIAIVPVAGTKTFLDFCKVPRLIYKGAKGFAPPLDAERWTLHGAKLNPHFELVDHKEWVARKDGKLVGRISAQVYKDGHTPVGASRMQFGCLDAIEDEAVVDALLGAAEAWLAERGAGPIHGPFSPSVNSECGMLVEGFTAVPMIFMPWNPAYLPR